MSNRVSDRLLFLIRLTILAICAFVSLSGRFPPAFAQRMHYTIETIPVITTTDSLQNDHIDAINKHLQASDDNIKALQLAVTQLTSDIAVAQGQVRELLGLLALLVAGGYAVQIYRKRDSPPRVTLE